MDPPAAPTQRPPSPAPGDAEPASADEPEPPGPDRAAGGPPDPDDPPPSGNGAAGAGAEPVLVAAAIEADPGGGEERRVERSLVAILGVAAVLFLLGGFGEIRIGTSQL